MTTATGNELLNARELAAFLEVGHTTIHRWRRERKLPNPILKPGKSVKWRKSDIGKWLAAYSRGEV